MYIIAEIGSNYNSLKDCIKSIEIAKICGADAVKFQHYTATEMWGSGLKEVTPLAWLPALSAAAKCNNIEFSCTFFSPEKLAQYDEMLNFVKIASSNMMDIRLLRLAKSLGKRTIISTGGHKYHEVSRVHDFFPEAEFLYCESVYPSHINNYDKCRFGITGVSDHSLDTYPNFPPRVKTVEKHVNLCGAKGTDDEGHALSATLFKRYCDHLKKGGIPDLLSPEEEDMRLLHNVRLTATQDIAKGQEFTWRNVDVKRGIKKTAKYISPMDYKTVIGMEASRDIQAWRAIEPGDIQAT